jgi:hypothetical protein
VIRPPFTLPEPTALDGLDTTAPVLAADQSESTR